MGRTTHSLLGLLAAVVLVPSAACTAEPAPAPAVAPAPAAAGLDFAAEPRPPGRVPGNIQDHGHIVNEYAQARPAEYTSVTLTAEAIEVALPGGGDLEARKAAVDDLVAAPIRFLVVDRSAADLAAVRAQLDEYLRSGDHGGKVVGVGSGGPAGTVTVYIDAALPDADSLDLRRTLRDRFGDVVAFQKMGQITRG